MTRVRFLSSGWTGPLQSFHLGQWFNFYRIDKHGRKFRCAQIRPSVPLIMMKVFQKWEIDLSLKSGSLATSLQSKWSTSAVNDRYTMLPLLLKDLMLLHKLWRLLVDSKFRFLSHTLPFKDSFLHCKKHSMLHTLRVQPITPHQFPYSILYWIICIVYASAMVTSTSTPGSMLMDVICLTISDGLCRSIRRLWILIWKRSQVLDPSPQGVFLVVMRRVWREQRNQMFSLTKLKRIHNIPYNFSLYKWQQRKDGWADELTHQCTLQQQRHAFYSHAVISKYLSSPFQYLGWHADRSLHLQVLLLSPTDQVCADWG